MANLRMSVTSVLPPWCWFARTFLAQFRMYSFRLLPG